FPSLSFIFLIFLSKSNLFIHIIFSQPKHLSFISAPSLSICQRFSPHGWPFLRVIISFSLYFFIFYPHFVCSDPSFFHFFFYQGPCGPLVGPLVAFSCFCRHLYYIDYRLKG